MLGSNCGTPKKGQRDPDGQGHFRVDLFGDQVAESSWILRGSVAQGANFACGGKPNSAPGFVGRYRKPSPAINCRVQGSWIFTIHVFFSDKAET